MSQVYFSPDFYYATETVSGESPAASPAKWQALKIPLDLKQPIALLAASQLHRNAEQGVALYQQASAALLLAIQEASRRDGRYRQRNIVTSP